MQLKIYFLSVLALAALPAIADEAYLDRPYKNLNHPVDDVSVLSKSDVLDDSDVLDETSRLPHKNDVEKFLALQTAVKSQAKRGTCSIFSATAILEALMVQQGHFKNDLDLSEEWLE